MQTILAVATGSIYPLALIVAKCVAPLVATTTTASHGVTVATGATPTTVTATATATATAKSPIKK